MLGGKLYRDNTHVNDELNARKMGYSEYHDYENGRRANTSYLVCSSILSIILVPVATLLVIAYIKTYKDDLVMRKVRSGRENKAGMEEIKNKEV